VLLLIALLGSLVAWLTGKIAEEVGLHRQYQANSIRHHRVLSFFYLGCQVLRDKNRKLKLSAQELLKTCSNLQVELNTL
jgi:hypothetical protein